MTERFDDQLLKEFAHTYYGYGNYGGEFWFIGMEEGGGNSFEGISNRLNAWAKRGKHELEDLAEYHAEIGITRHFNDNPKLQPTWNKLIRILLSSQGHEVTTEQVREYQRISLGRRNGGTCLVELLPLPSPSKSKKDWLYAHHSQLSYLADRSAYQQTYLKPRIAHLKRRLNEQKPRAVIFYGLGYREHWQAIADVDFLTDSSGVSLGRNGSSLFVMVTHPVTTGVTSEYFHQVGRMISAELKVVE